MKEDSHGKISGYLHIDETDKRKNFPKRFFILDKNTGLCRWFKDKPEVFINLNNKLFISYNS